MSDSQRRRHLKVGVAAAPGGTIEERVEVTACGIYGPLLDVVTSDKLSVTCCKCMAIVKEMEDAIEAIKGGGDGE